jgi:hypothetical protein
MACRIACEMNFPEILLAVANKVLYIDWNSIMNEKLTLLHLETRSLMKNLKQLGTTKLDPAPYDTRIRISQHKISISLVHNKRIQVDSDSKIPYVGSCKNSSQCTFE